MAQPQVKTYLSLNGPPIVKKNLQWPPHRNPADDGQAFAGEVIAGTGAKIADEVGGNQTERNEDETDRGSLCGLVSALDEVFGVYVRLDRRNDYGSLW